MALAIAVLSIGAFAPEAKAQADVTTFIGSGTTTNNVAAASTNTYAIDISAPKSGNIALSLICTMSNATNSTVNWVFKPVDGNGNVSTVAGQWTTVPVIVQTNSRAEVYITNFNWGSVPVWRLTSIGNTNAGAYVTNIIGKAIKKTSI